MVGSDGIEFGAAVFIGGKLGAHALHTSRSIWAHISPSSSPAAAIVTPIGSITTLSPMNIGPQLSQATI